MHPIFSTSVVPPGRNKFGRGCAKNLPPASFLHAAPVKRKGAGDEQAYRLFVSTGVVRIGLPRTGSPVDLAPGAVPYKAAPPHNNPGWIDVVET